MRLLLCCRIGDLALFRDELVGGPFFLARAASQSSKMSAFLFLGAGFVVFFFLVVLEGAVIIPCCPRRHRGFSREIVDSNFFFSCSRGLFSFPATLGFFGSFFFSASL